MTEYVFMSGVHDYVHWTDAAGDPRDDLYYQIQSERSRILSEKETLEKVYQTLLEEHRTLQTNYDDVVSEKDDALSQLRQAQREADNPRVDSRGDAMLRGEIDRLRSDLYVFWSSSVQLT